MPKIAIIAILRQKPPKIISKNGQNRLKSQNHSKSVFLRILVKISPKNLFFAKKLLTK